MSAATPSTATIAVHFDQSAEQDLDTQLRALMPDLLNYLRRRTATAEDAADRLSETLEVLWRKKDRIPTGDDGLRRWAYGIAQKTAQSQHRQARTRSALDDVLRHRFIDVVPDHEPGEDLLAVLDARDRELVELIVLDGFPINEAAAILNLRPGTARMRHSRARARLRDLLA